MNTLLYSMPSSGSRGRRRAALRLPLLWAAILAFSFLAAARGQDDVLRPPFVVDCGPPTDERWDDERSDTAVRVLVDRSLARGGSYGHESGEGFRRWNATVWGRPERELRFFRSGRVAPESYRFRVPAGAYRIGLGFCEGWHHVPGQRVFDVVLQGRTALESVDPFDIAGYSQAFRLLARTVVAEGDDLEIVLRPRRGEPVVNAIWVYRDSALTAAIEPPERAWTFGTYGANAVFWTTHADPTVVGYVVERRTEGEAEYSRLPLDPLPVARCIDRDVEAGQRYSYRVRAVGLDGRSSRPASAGDARPRSPSQSSLPWYELAVRDDALEYVLSAVTERREVDAILQLGKRGYPVELRVRGASTRFAAKLSHRIEFPGERPFPDREVIYLKAQPFDFTMQQEKLSCDVFASLDVPISRARYVNLSINGRYAGVTLDMEPVRGAFRKTHDLDPDGVLVRSWSFHQLEDGRVPGLLEGDADDRRDRAVVAEFLRAVNRLGDGEIGEYLRRATEWERVRDYYVGAVLCHRSEIEANDSFYYRDTRTGRFALIPWDNNNGNFGVIAAGARIEEPRVGPFGPMSLQSLRGRHRWWYVIPTRMFHDEALRADYLARLRERVGALLVEGGIGKWISRNHERVREDWLRDPLRWPPGRDLPFERSRERLIEFCREHGRRVLERIEQATTRREPKVEIHELGLRDNEAWIELRNRTDRAVGLGGFAVGPLRGGELTRRRFGDEHRLPPGGVVAFAMDELHREEIPGDDDFLDDDDTEGDDEPGDISEAEADERRRLRERRRAQLRACVVDSLGGSIGLWDLREFEARREDRRTDDEFREGGTYPIDWLFYPRLSDGVSYGRDAARRWRYQEPTPGRGGPGASLRPPPLLVDGGVHEVSEGKRELRVFATDYLRNVQGEELEVTAQVLADDQESTLALERAPELPTERPPRTTTCWRAELPEKLHDRPLRYYFLARTAKGVERTAPLTAPREVYGGGSEP